MNLDISNWVDGIICDYNYAFDPNAKLKRYFGDGVAGEYIFLVDEAHNLVERAREMYSAIIVKEDVLKIKRMFTPISKRISGNLDKLNKAMLHYKRMCDENFMVLPEIEKVIIPLMRYIDSFEKYYKKIREQVAIPCVYHTEDKLF